MLLCPTADTSGAATGSELQRSAAAGRYLLLDDAVPEPAEAHFHLHAARHLSYKVTWGIWRIYTRRAGKLYKARSRLYRSQILQVLSKYLVLM